MLARLFTHGWDVFCPGCPIAFHQWERSARPHTLPKVCGRGGGGLRLPHTLPKMCECGSGGDCFCGLCAWPSRWEPRHAPCTSCCAEGGGGGQAYLSCLNAMATLARASALCGQWPPSWGRSKACQLHSRVHCPPTRGAPPHHACLPPHTHAGTHTR